MVIPILPFLIESMGASGRALGLLMATFALMQLIFSPVWGSLSDRIGRKPVLMIGVFGFGITMVLFGLSTELWMLFAARALSGILSSATLPTSMAYISDSTTEEQRGGGMGVVGAAMGLGMVLGPGLGGLLAGKSLAVPFFIAGGLSFLAMILILAFLPESLPKEQRQTEGKVRFINLSELWQALKSPIGVLLLMAFLVSFGLTAFEGIFGLYALERFDYGPQQVGTILMVIGFVSAANPALGRGNGHKGILVVECRGFPAYAASKLIPYDPGDFRILHAGGIAAASSSCIIDLQAGDRWTGCRNGVK